jgi:hypothetical protein
VLEKHGATIGNPIGSHGGDSASHDEALKKCAVVSACQVETDHTTGEQTMTRFEKQSSGRNIDHFDGETRTHARVEDAMLKARQTSRPAAISQEPPRGVHC